MFAFVGIACAALLGSVSSFERSHESLFENWGTTLHVPAITLGVPSSEELEESNALLDDIYGQLVASTSDALTTSQRELEIPFAMGMIEGIRAVQGDKHAAHACLKHLADLDDAVEGLSASRILRMRLHAHVCLGNDAQSLDCATRLLEMADADIEDQLVAVLYGSKDPDYEKWDRRCVAMKRNDLRWAFACGVTRLNHLKSLSAVFSLADKFVQQGAGRTTMDMMLQELLQRLDPPVTLSEHHRNTLVATLASRLAVNDDLSKKKYASAKNRLLQLTLLGCVYSSEQLLTIPELEPSDFELSSALELVMQYPSQSSCPLSYWQLVAASHAAKAGDKAEAIVMLEQVSQDAKHYADALLMLQFLRGTDVLAIKQELDFLASTSKNMEDVITKIHAPEIAEQLLRQYVDQWHVQGIEKTPWLPDVIKALVNKATGCSPAMLGESHRLLGQLTQAKHFFKRSIDMHGETLQTAIGLADCNRDAAAMSRAGQGLAASGEHKYWFWLANARLVQWFRESGGDQMKATAKVNRLRRLDPELGGEQFAVVFQAAVAE